jgi:protein involved in polysaccharide export with SLBB domain
MSHERVLHAARAVATPFSLMVALLCGCLTWLPVAAAGAQVASRNIARSDSAAFAKPGDVVRLKIWREPDMSGDYTVDATGIATLPRLGALQVSGVGADSLQRLLVAEYARFLRNPSVEVVLLRRVRVVGAVRAPGLYTADPTMHVRDVLALAGGATPEGRTDFVRLDRNGRSTPVDLGRAPRVGEIGLQSGDQLFVPQRSWMARNTPLLAAIVSVSGGLLIALATR